MNKEKILKEIDRLKSLKKECDANFSQYSTYTIANLYIGYINGEINVSDRDTLAIEIHNMTKSYNRSCRCEKKLKR